MNQKDLMGLAEEIVAGIAPNIEQLKAIAAIKDSNAYILFPGADMIRNNWFGREVHLCMILNGKSGKCSEDCCFCSQSAFSNTDAPIYPLLARDELIRGGLYASETPINRYSIVTSGKQLPPDEVEIVSNALAELDYKKISTCASLGTLGTDDLKMLKEAGVTRYHHNLETSSSFFNQICTTHTYDDRVKTITRSKEAGLSVCSGGIFGMGETDEQILEMALALKELDVDAIPLNFLLSIKGTPKENYNDLTPLRCLKIISLFRYVMPDKDIIVCGGREDNLKELHPMIFHAGASGIMTADYLTMHGRSLEKDLEMLEHLKYTIRDKGF